MCKRIATILLMLGSLTIFLFGCTYVAYQDEFTQLVDYPNIWELSGFHHGYTEDTMFFPKEITYLEVEDFYCRYDQQLPLGEGIQVFLRVAYETEDTFEAEMERLSSMAFACDEYFKETGFAAYATRLGTEGVSEYVLVDAENRVLCYIYLQSLPKSEVMFDQSLLPEGYTGYGEIE